MKKITFRDSIRWNKESFMLFKKTPNQSLMLSLAYLFIFMLLPSMPMIQIFFNCVYLDLASFFWYSRLTSTRLMTKIRKKNL